MNNLNHLFLDRTFLGKKENVKIENNFLVLNENSIEGYYETEEYNQTFYEVVTSWSCDTSIDRTVECLVRVKVNDNWSKYFSYGEWGLGLENKCLPQDDETVKMVEDEIKIKNNFNASSVQVKIILRRKGINVASPRVSLIAISLNIKDYQYNIDISKLPTQIDYEVPKLCQHTVDKIGNIICSPTSITMLLKYKGHDFTNILPNEHEYIAKLAYDHGNEIFGNWVYNTVTASNFDEISYVKRCYSYQEIMKHLVEVGPVALSIRGEVNGSLVKSWKTSGHLLVIRGYRIENNQVTFLANDPNINTVYEEYTLENFLKFSRNVIYVIE